MNAQHTPTPWVAKPYHPRLPTSGAMIENADGEHIADVYNIDGNAFDDGAFIAEACSAHDALTARVAELEKSEQRLREFQQRQTDGAIACNAYIATLETLLRKLVGAVDRMPANAADGIADEIRATLERAK